MDQIELYLRKVDSDLEKWKFDQQKKPSKINKLTAKVQSTINSYIPEKVHKGITNVIKPMVKAVLYGSKYSTSTAPPLLTSFIHREALVKSKIESYRNTGAAEGGITGAGGFFMSMADFPILIGIKFKLLFEIASIYGFNVKDYKERLYILHIFQLAFSSQEGRIKVFHAMQNWDQKTNNLPPGEADFDWQTFQQEYRDYIDIAKLAQLLPVVGAAVGAIANYKLIEKLGNTAIMCYRMRIKENNLPLKNINL